MILSYKEVGECWEYQGNRTSNGYARRGRKGLLLHREVYRWCHPDFDESLLIRHTCNNPPCIRPEHLLEGTPQDNMNDKVAAGNSRKNLLLPDEYMEDIVGLVKLGWTQQKIADFYGVSNQTISIRLKQWGDPNYRKSKRLS